MGRTATQVEFEQCIILFKTKRGGLSQPLFSIFPYPFQFRFAISGHFENPKMTLLEYYAAVKQTLEPILPLQQV